MDGRSFAGDGIHSVGTGFKTTLHVVAEPARCTREFVQGEDEEVVFVLDGHDDPTLGDQGPLACSGEPPMLT